MNLALALIFAALGSVGAILGAAGVDSGATSLTVNKPTGTAQNDVMIAAVSVRPNTAGLTSPSGWTLVRTVENTGGAAHVLAIYRKVAGASEPTSYTWTLSNSTGAVGGIQSFSGVDTTSPIDVESGQATPNGLSHSTSSITTSSGATTISAFTYTLNAVGNRTQVVDGTGTTTYAYDSLHRLTAVTYPGPQTDTYTYDQVGNRLTKNATAYTYDNADQMTVAGGVNYTYDANGNQASRASDSYTWDHEDRMTGATIGGTAATYAYNGDGLRMSRTIGGQTASYVWDVAAGIPMLLQETTGGSTTTYVYGLGLISTTDNGGTQTYRLADGLGSTVNLTDAAGAVTGNYTYDVFGAVRSHTGAGTEFSFTGEQNDPNGYEYLRARYYDPAVGRFLSRDPLGTGYPYVSNNPANLVDRWGCM